MNWDQLKDPVSHMCLVGAVVASWSLTHEVAGSSLFTVMRIIFVSELAEFNGNIWEKLQCIQPMLFKLSVKLQWTKNLTQDQ